MTKRADAVKRIGAGLAFIGFPLVFIFAFAGHPDLLHPHFLQPEELIRRAHGRPLLHLGHGLVTINTGLLVVCSLHLMKRLELDAPWSGLIGGACAIMGAIILAADKGALCLTMSALDTLPDAQFDSMLPGLIAMFEMKGWLVLLRALPLLPLGFAIQAVALARHRVLPLWQSVLFLLGVLFIGVPDGVEIVNLTAAIMLACALIPYGVRLIVRSRDDTRPYATPASFKTPATQA